MIVLYCIVARRVHKLLYLRWYLLRGCLTSMRWTVIRCWQEGSANWFDCVVWRHMYTSSCTCLIVTAMTYTMRRVMKMTFLSPNALAFCNSESQQSRCYNIAAWSHSKSSP
ncbi:hypothetical protein ABBQ38_007027 [Trebouxia sp. C0009 RCD-2024]